MHKLYSFVCFSFNSLIKQLTYEIHIRAPAATRSVDNTRSANISFCNRYERIRNDSEWTHNQIKTQLNVLTLRLLVSFSSLLLDIRRSLCQSVSRCHVSIRLVIFFVSSVDHHHCSRQRSCVCVFGYRVEIPSVGVELIPDGSYSVRRKCHGWIHAGLLALQRYLHFFRKAHFWN